MKEEEGEDNYFLGKEELTSDTSLCLSDISWPSSWHIKNSREKKALLSCVSLLGFISIAKFVMNLLMEGHSFHRLNKNLLRKID